MGLLSLHCWCGTKPGSIYPAHLPLGRKYKDHCALPNFMPSRICSGTKIDTRAFAGRNSIKRLRRQGEPRKNVTPDPNKVDDPSGDEGAQDKDKMSSFDNLDSQKSTIIPSRSSVLKGCTVTSGLIAALGVLIRQVSHVAMEEGLPILDSSSEVSCISFQTWRDFAESSEVANQQVLSSLEPLDYIVVAFLPGISEELLFRGAMLPLFGLNWKSALLVAVIFGFLHLSSGRKYSFALWATFVGFAYGYATIVSSSIIVPVASHAANNLIGGLLWRYSSKSQKLRE